MTTNYLHKKENYKVDHSAFGGEITLEDFDTTAPNKQRINNQVDADKFKEQVMQTKGMNYIMNHYTLEELREMKLVSNTNGRPTSTLTDKKWQKEFQLRKLFITPHSESIKKLSGKYFKESGMWNEEIMGVYYGCTSWQAYCSYINDILDNIRSGQTDYCYFIFQIIELARFHYNTLKTRYCDGYWEVWLDR